MSVSLSLRPVHRTTRQNEQDKSKQESRIDLTAIRNTVGLSL